MSDILASGIRLDILRGLAKVVRVLPRGRTHAFRVGWRLIGAPDRFVGTIGSLPYVVDAHDLHTAVQQFLWQSWEPVTTVVFLSQVPNGGTVIDVGANKGFLSLSALTKIGPTGRVLSYEPVPANVADLLATRALNAAVAANWEIIPKAVSATAGTTQFHVFGMDRGHSGWGQVSVGGELTVEKVSLDEELERLKLSRVDAVKIDVEGHEIAVVRGLRESLRRRAIRSLLIELHPGAFTSDEYEEMTATLRSYEYRGHLLAENEETRQRAQKSLKSGNPQTAGLLDELPAAHVPVQGQHVLWTIE